MEMKFILIIGAGELGRAVGKLLEDKPVAVSFWDADPAKMPGQKKLGELVPAADCVLLCIPSWAVRDAASKISAAGLRKEAAVVAFSKGIEAQSLKTMGELLPELLPVDQPFAVVGGPMLAAEIMDGKPAAAVIASKNAAVAGNLRELFASDHFKAEVSDDVFGVSLAGVLKNIYAVALGIADGLRMDGNQKGLLAGRAMEEMAKAAKALGAGAEAVSGTAGFADFLATAYSPYSRNRETGEEIVKSGKCGLKGEGLVSLLPLMDRLGAALDAKAASGFPLLQLIRMIAVDCEPAGPAFESFWKSGQAL
ncbi:MAG: hypothetical protein KGJ13_04295 [Patescibacteria group bacterium]|nr:hypothetical protein [Patescibacteria group bacterium]